MRQILLSLPLLALAVSLSAAETKTWIPSDEEAYAITLLNAYRGDRVRGDNAVAMAIRRKEIAGDIKTWSKAITPPEKAPPLVPNPLLGAAASALLAAGATAIQGQATDAAGPLAAAGYSPSSPGVVLLASGVASPELAFYGAIAAQVGEKPRADRPPLPICANTAAMRKDMREVGIALVHSRSGWAIAIVLGAGAGKRLLGGVTYQDLDHNGAYDPGEGRGGITVGIGGASTLSTPSGVWWLAGDGRKELTVAFTGQGETATRTVPGDETTAEVPWSMPIPADCTAADRLLAAAEKATAAKNANPDSVRKPLADLLAGTRLASLDDGRRARIDALVQPIKADFDNTLGEVLAALGEEPATFRKHLAELRKPWKGALAEWFAEAQETAALRQRVIAAQAAPAEQKQRLVAQTIPALQRAIRGARDPAFLGQLRLWLDDMQAAASAEPAAPAAGQKKK